MNIKILKYFLDDMFIKKILFFINYHLIHHNIKILNFIDFFLIFINKCKLSEN